jgi:hypothetical protein
MENNNSNEFSTIQIVPGSRKIFKTPAICPGCSQPATKSTKIMRHTFEFSSVFSFFAFITNFFKVIVGVASFDILLSVKICQSCYESYRKYKILSWVARIGCIVLLLITVSTLSTPQRPLARQGTGMLLLGFSPLFLGAFLAYFLERRAELCKGVVFVRNHDYKTWFHAVSSDWQSEFLLSNSTNENNVSHK